jgi:hypothetical protein
MAIPSSHNYFFIKNLNRISRYGGTLRRRFISYVTPSQIVTCFARYMGNNSHLRLNLPDRINTFPKGFFEQLERANKRKSMLFWWAYKRKAVKRGGLTVITPGNDLKRVKMVQKGLKGVKRGVKGGVKGGSFGPVQAIRR